MDIVLNIVGWLARLALLVYVIYLAVFKAEPSMHNIMFVVGITYIDLMLMRIAQASR